jgi:hypothetical protein
MLHVTPEIEERHERRARVGQRLASCSAGGPNQAQRRSLPPLVPGRRRNASDGEVWRLNGSPIGVRVILASAHGNSPGISARTTCRNARRDARP